MFSAHELYASSDHFPEVYSKRFVSSNENCIFLSSSADPWETFGRGDLLLVTNYHTEPIGVGDIVVFEIEGRDIPIVHRVIRLHAKYRE